MDRLAYLLWLMKEVAEALISFGAITLIPLSLLLGGISYDVVRSKLPFKDVVGILLANFAISLLILVGGVVFGEPGQHQSGDRWKQALIVLFFFSHIPLAGFLAYRFDRQRWTALSAMMLGLWVSFWALFLASMSISGDWL